MADVKSLRGYGGMLKKDMTPKESYHRLAKLQRDWGVSKSQRQQTA